MKKIAIFGLACLVFGLLTPAAAQEIYWGNSVPKGWNGTWDAKFLTVPEKTNYVKTTSSTEVLEFINTLRWNSENVGTINMFTSSLRKVCAAVVLASPRVTTPEQAKASGKPVIYIQGNIHPPESEAKEAVLMLMREILFGKKKHLLDNQIIIFCPNFNVDGNDTLGFNDRTADTPYLLGARTNFQNLDLNRDAIKLQTIEVEGLYRNVINPWDPVFLYDGHAMGRINHGYAIVYATSTVPAAHPAPRSYVYENMFPVLRQSVRDNFGLEIFTHCNFDEENWPPTVWDHEKASWTTEGKFIAAAFGLRNRMSILAETPGQPTFERKIYAQYALVDEILEYTNVHGKEMMAICKKADQEVVEKVLARAGSGNLKNFIEGKYESWGKIDILAYQNNDVQYIPGTSVPGLTPASALGAPAVIHGVEHFTKPVGTKEATMPRGYLIPAALAHIAEKLRIQNVRVTLLEKPLKVSGEEFVIDKLGTVPSSGYNMTRLKGQFRKIASKEFPAGTYHVDLAQPLADLAFYSLEPEVGDGFVGWGVLTDYLESLGVNKNPVVYPVFKYLEIMK